MARDRRGVRPAPLPVTPILLGLLPRRSAMAIACVAGRVRWHLDGRTRWLMLDHLAVAFPGKSDGERAALGASLDAALHAMGECREALVGRDLGSWCHGETSLPGAGPGHVRARSMFAYGKMRPFPGHACDRSHPRLRHSEGPKVAGREGCRGPARGT